MSSLYPRYEDVFTVKKDETGDGTGHYVMADHINALQDAIVAVERTLGTSPHGNYENVRDRISALERMDKSFRIPSVCLYHGDPYMINGSVSVAEAADRFGYFDYVILPSDIENPSNPLRDKAIQIIEKASSTKFSGTVDTSIASIDSIKIRVQNLKSMGAAGVYLYKFGYEFGSDRARQNEILDYVHQSGMFALFSSADPANILSSGYASGKNPANVPLSVGPSDVFIHFGFGKDGFKSVADSLISYRAQMGFKLFAITPNDELYDYKYALATLYSYDAFYAQDDTYGSDNHVEINRIVPVLGNFYSQNPAVVTQGNTLIRHTRFGTIQVNIETKEFSFDHLRIPGYLIDTQSIESEITWQAMAPNVIQAINSEMSSGFISPDKIAPFDIYHAEKLVAGVIEAINIGAENINAESISAKVIESFSLNSNLVIAQAISAGLVDAIDIVAQAGEFDRVSTNIINAINANIENAKITGARVADLDASQITTGWISAERIAPESIHSDHLSIGLIRGVDKWRYTYIIDNHEEPIVPTIDLFYGRLYNASLEIEDRTTFDLVEIFGGILPSHIGLIETNLVVYDSIPSEETQMTAIGSGNFIIYVDGTPVVTHTGPTYNQPVQVTFPILVQGVHKIQIAYENRGASTPIILSRKLSQKLPDNPGRYVIPGLQRMDCYVEDTTIIEGGKIKTRSIDAEQIKANTITAESGVIADAAITNAMIRDVHAEKITAGDIDAERIKVAVLEAATARISEIIADTLNAEKAEIKDLSAEMINALNFYGDNITAGMATINSAVIGELSVDNLKAQVVKAVVARVQDLIADRVVIGDAEIKSLAAQMIDALNVHAETIEAGEALIDSAVIGELTADKIKAAAVEALTARIQELTAENAFVRSLAAELVNAINVRAETIQAGEALFTAATISELTAEQIQASVIDALRIAVGNITGDDAAFKQLVADLITSQVINAVNVKITSSAGGGPNDALLTIDQAGIVIASKPKANPADIYWPADAQVLVLNKDGIGVSVDGGRNWQFKMTGNGLYVADGQILNVSANKLIAGDIKATESIRFIGSAGTNGEGLIIDDTGLTVYDTGDAMTAMNLVRITSAGIQISHDGGFTWSTKLDGSRLYVDSADINSLTADKITAGNIAANGTINVGDGVELSNDGIIVTGAKGIEITEGTLQVTEDSEARIIFGKLGEEDYGLQLNTSDDKVITLNKSGLSADNFTIGSDGNVTITGTVNAESGYLKDLSVTGTMTVTQGNIDTDSVKLDSTGLVVKEGKTLAVGSNFSVDSDGNVTMTNANVSASGTFAGTIKAASGHFGTENDEHVVIDSKGLVLGSGSIVDTRDEEEQSLKLDVTSGLTATKGTIGGVIIGKMGMIAGGTIITDDGLQVTGQGGIVVEDGDIRIKDGQTGYVYVTAGKLPEAGGLPESRGIEITSPDTDYRMRLDGYGVVIQKSPDEKIFVADTDGNLEITGTVNAKSGYFGNENVYVDDDGIIVGEGGNIVVNGGTIKAGTTVTLSNSGLAITNGAAGINVNNTFVVSGAGSVTATSGSIAGITFDSNKLTAGQVIINRTGLIQIGSVIDLGLIDHELYGMRIKGTYPITINSTGISSTNFSVSTSTGNVNIKGYIRATSGWFGTDESNAVTIDGSSLKFVGTGSITGNGFSLSSAGLSLTGGTGTIINLNDKFTVTSEGHFTATSGKIAGVLITEEALVGGGINFGAEGINVKAGHGITVTDGTIVIKEGEDHLIEMGALDDFSGIRINTTSPITIGSDGIQSPNFKLNANGSVEITGSITAQSGTFSGTVQSNSGYFGTSTNGVAINATGLKVVGSGSIVAGQSQLNSNGIFLGNDTSIILGSAFSANNTGITASAGTIAGWKITNNSISSSDDGIILTSTGKGSINIGSGIALNGNGTAVLGKLNINSDGSMWLGNTSESAQFKVDPQGNITFTGNLTGATGTFSGTVSATSGNIGGWTINADNIASGNIVLDSTGKITVGTNVTLDGLGSGKLTVGNFEATGGSIGGLIIGPDNISAPNFLLKSDGSIEAGSAKLRGELHADIGTFGTGPGSISASDQGIWTGSEIGDPLSTFWISSITKPDPRDPSKTIFPGDAFFKGSVSVGKDSFIDGGNLILEAGSIIAGTPAAAHVRMTFDPYSPSGGEIYSQINPNDPIFRVNKLGAYFKGDITATKGTISGDLSVGEGGNIYIEGRNNSELGIIPGIYLYNTDRTNPDRVVRLTNDGLFVSQDGGQTYEPAITGSGINANTIKNGTLYIEDYGGGASGIVVRQWNTLQDQYVENVKITPAGIHVLNGAITVQSDQTGEVLIGGGYLRVKGLDMGVVTSNNFIGNGTFNMVSEDYGVMQKNQGEVFLGKAQSSGGAVSNPTYHYVGWPDFGNRDPHTIYTYKINPDGTINSYNPANPLDPNRPNIVRSSFNPQWSAVHPNYPYCIVPADADNFITIIDYDGNIVKNLKAWKGGLFGAAFTPDGNKMIVCGDDIDRKRAPWDMVVYDTSNPDPTKWERIGVIPVGEFPSKVVCDDKGFAYATVSLDNTLYKLDLNNMRVDAIMTLTDERGIPVIPMPISISNDYEYIYVGGVVSDIVYEIPTSFAVPFTSCRRFSVLPYPGNRGIIHDLKTLPDGRIVTSSASTTDAAITIIDPELGSIVTYIDSSMNEKLACPPDAPPEVRANWNFYSSTTLEPHPTLPLVYVTVTNRCMLSILDYSSGELVEITRVPAGSNCSGVSISKDGLRAYVPNHHYHTYPLGANRVWGYNADTNFYATDDVFDTTQRYWHHNPSGIVTTGNGRYVWVANRATDRIVIIDTETWGNQNTWQYIENVGNQPYELKLNHSGTKLFVSNNDTDDQYEPDFVTIIDVATRSIEGKIYVGDCPVGIEVSQDNKYLYVACQEGRMIQKADIISRRVIDSVNIDGSPRHLLLVGNDLYVSCYDANKVIKLDAATLDVVGQIIPADESDLTMQAPNQIVAVNGKLYVTNQGSDNVMVVDIATNTKEKFISTGSRPGPIAYNAVKKIIYVGNSGEGSVCIIDADPISPTYNEVIEWCMTGDNPKYIAVSPDGLHWYVSAHGPEDIISYGEGTPYTGDAYLDNSGITHKYGSAYWMPSRSKWTRGVDNTLTSFSSVEFWPSAKLQGKQGYAHLTVMGMYDAFAKIEQDVYPLINASDGACEFKIEEIDLEESTPRELEEEVADYSDIPGMEHRKVVVCDAYDPEIKYVEGTDYVINYSRSTIRRFGSGIPASRIRQNTAPLVDTTPVSLMENGYKYNFIKVYPANTTSNPYTEGQDYIIDRENNTIARTEGSRIPSGAIVTIEYRYFIKVRYYYHPFKRNYEDVVLSADMFWRWPRPENQWVRMQIDELVPKFIYVDNDQVNPWQPKFDFGKGSFNVTENRYVYYDSDMNILPDVPTYKGLIYSSNVDRVQNATFITSAVPTSGLLDSLKKGNSTVVLPPGEQHIIVDIGTQYYVNEIIITHALDGRTMNNARVEISTDGEHWTEVYNEENSPCQYTVRFPKAYGEEIYYGPERVRYVKSTINGDSIGSNNQWKQIKVMGDWKVNTSYTFASNTIWDSEGVRETFLTLGEDKVRFDNPVLTTDPLAPNVRPTDRVRYRIYYTRDDGTHNVRGEIRAFDTFGSIEYHGAPDRVRQEVKLTAAIASNVPIELSMYSTINVQSLQSDRQYIEGVDYIIQDNTIRRTANSSIIDGATVTVEALGFIGSGYDFVYDYMTNTMQRTPDSSIPLGREIRVIYRFVQEDLSNLPLSVSHKDPNTGIVDMQSSVAETDATGAWIEWEFENEYRCDWYIGWIADIGLGNVNIYLDGKLVHSISQNAAKIERYSQLSQDLLPGKHKIRLVQQQGRVNFDIIKLEDFQLYSRSSNLVASPSINPVELFDWYNTKLTPGEARKYLGRGTQITSGAYETVQTDKITRLPNNQVPIKYRVRFQTTLEGRGEPVDGEGSYGGEATKNEFSFERGSVMITDVIMEYGVNPTYWRMAPTTDKYPGFAIESWDPQEPKSSGIQTHHLADGSITGDKIKKFEIKDIHIANDAMIQESKLDLNFPTHGHGNKEFLDLLAGFGSSGSSNYVARADHTHDELANGNFTGDVSVGGNLTVSGEIKELNKPHVVHARPLYGIGSDLQFQSSSHNWELLTSHYDLFSFAMPNPQPGATRKYRLYALYGDNITASDTIRARIRIVTKEETPQVVCEWKLPHTWGSPNGRRDAYSDMFIWNQTGKDYDIEVAIQNDLGNYAGELEKEVGIEWLELIAYDVFEEV